MRSLCSLVQFPQSNHNKNSEISLNSDNNHKDAIDQIQLCCIEIRGNFGRHSTFYRPSQHSPTVVTAQFSEIKTVASDKSSDKPRKHKKTAKTTDPPALHRPGIPPPCRQTTHSPPETLPLTPVLTLPGSKCPSGPLTAWPTPSGPDTPPTCGPS